MAQQTELWVNALPGGVHSFLAKAAQVPTIPGLEFTLPVNRMHCTLEENRPHFTIPIDRMHFDILEED